MEPVIPLALIALLGCAEGVTGPPGVALEPEDTINLLPEGEPLPALASRPPARPTVVAGSQLGNMVVLEDGSVWGWGWFGRRYGKVGGYETRYPNSAWAVPVPELRGVVDLGHGYESGCALHAGGSVTCWGSMGDPSAWTGEAYGAGVMPVWHIPISGVVALEAAGALACALVRDGSVWCWGRGENGELGQGLPLNSATPVRLNIPTRVVELSIGGQTSLARDVEGSVWAWPPTYLSHEDYLASVDDPMTDCSPRRIVTGPSGVVALAAGSSTDYCILIGDGSIRCAGPAAHNYYGGDPYGLKTMELPPVHALSRGHSNFCALLDAGAVQCWGWFVAKHHGKSYRPEDHYVPVAGGALRISGGVSRHCAIMQDGSVQCWGSSPFGDGSPHGLDQNVTSKLDMEPRTVLWAYAPGKPQ